MEYKLKTVEDILKVVNESNVENFKLDFASWLDLHIKMRKFVGKELPEFELQEGDVFHWIDDGKNNATLDIKIKS